MASSNARGSHSGSNGNGPQRGGYKGQRPPPRKARWPSESALLVVDLEATCWNGKPPPGNICEIIEIGVALVDLTQNPPVTIRDGTILVKPTRSTVSPFCTELTTITTELLEAEGVSLEEAFRILVTDWNSDKLSWSSWGDYDRNMVNKQCGIFGLTSPFSSTHYNIKDIYKLLYPQQRGAYGMSTSYERIIGRAIEGTHHRGGDDAKNIATILNKLMTMKPSAAQTANQGPAA